MIYSEVKAIVNHGNNFLLVRTQNSGNKWKLIGGILGADDDEIALLEMKSREYIGSKISLRGKIDSLIIPDKRRVSVSIEIYSGYISPYAKIRQGTKILDYSFFQLSQVNSLNLSPTTQQVFSHLFRINYLALCQTLPERFPDGLSFVLQLVSDKSNHV